MFVANALAIASDSAILTVRFSITISIFTVCRKALLREPDPADEAVLHLIDRHGVDDAAIEVDAFVVETKDPVTVREATGGLRLQSCKQRAIGRDERCTTAALLAFGSAPRSNSSTSSA